MTSADPSTELHAISTGKWTLYYHAPDDKSWTADSYKRVHPVTSWEELGAVLRELGSQRVVGGMMFAMRGDTSPLWENRANIRGGSYCLKVTRRNAEEVYRRYLAAAAAGLASTNPENPIVGVTMSPKKGFSIIKLWNANAKAFNSQGDVALLHEEIKLEEIIYRPHTDQKM
jgi:hypothetical protein